MDDGMILQELFDLWRLMVQCMINKKYDFFEPMSLGISDKITEMFAKLDVPSAFIAVPDDVLLWPEHGDKEVTSFGIS
jgi:hypothetical protein